MKKNGFFTFCCALVPGCGQMYQGYMKRGLSLMAWFCAVIGLAVLLRLDFILVILPVIWFYSFFDAFNIRSLSPEQRAAFGDSFIPNSKWLSGHEELAGKINVSKVAGWALVVLGVLMLGNRLWQGLLSFAYDYFRPLVVVLDALPAVLIGVAVVVLGLYILRKGAAPKEEPPVPTPHMPEYMNTPPAPAAPEAAPAEVDSNPIFDVGMRDDQSLPAPPAAPGLPEDSEAN